MKISIHQPTFMPWYGFFSKIAHSDCWIVLDHTSNNPKDSAFFSRRVKILVNGEPFWISIPLVKSSTKDGQGIPLNQIKINTKNTKIFKKLQQTIEMAYKKAPYFKEYSYLVEDYFNHESDYLNIRNLSFIKEVMKILEIETKIVYSSDFNFSTKSNELLVDLLKKNQAKTYLCGNGASEYQNDTFFTDNNIQLEYSNVKHPVYRQLRRDNCLKGLSILDLLFNLKKEEIIEYLSTK
jgi:hypothetical protein